MVESRSREAGREMRRSEREARTSFQALSRSGSDMWCGAAEQTPITLETELPRYMVLIKCLPCLP